MADPTYPLFPVVAFLGFVLSFVPFSWHLQAWNAGTCMYMFWAGLASLVQFVNSIVWHDNARNPIPVWCDISMCVSPPCQLWLIRLLATKFIIGAGVGIPAASLCINRRLYTIAAGNRTSIGPQEVSPSFLFVSHALTVDTETPRFVRRSGDFFGSACSCDVPS